LIVTKTLQNTLNPEGLGEILKADLTLQHFRKNRIDVAHFLIFFCALNFLYQAVKQLERKISLADSLKNSQNPDIDKIQDTQVQYPFK